VIKPIFVDCKSEIKMPFTTTEHQKPSLLIVGAGFDGGGATPVVLSEVFTQPAFKPFDITFVGFGNGVERTFKGIHCINLPDPYVGGKHPFVRLCRKIRSCTNQDIFPSGAGYVFQMMKKRLRKKRFDLVLGAPGLFMECAYKYSILTKSKFGMIYTDPFSLNPLAGKFKEKRCKKEYAWESLASVIFYDNDGPVPPFGEFDQKKNIFYFPIAGPISSLPEPKKSIVYGGAFYKGLREQDGIYNLAKRQDMQDYTFDIYSDICPPPGIPNLKVHGYVKKDVFESKCLDAKAIIVVGNKTNMVYIPSKYLTDISLRRPIIGVDSGAELKYLQKYPFFVSSRDENLRKKLESFTNEELLSFNPYLAYPERDPDIIASKIAVQIKDIL